MFAGQFNNCWTFSVTSSIFLSYRMSAGYCCQCFCTVHFHFKHFIVFCTSAWLLLFRSFFLCQLVPYVPEATDLLQYLFFKMINRRLNCLFTFIKKIIPLVFIPFFCATPHRYADNRCSFWLPVTTCFHTVQFFLLFPWLYTQRRK